jgi:3',5'-cyclic AMP phosphodiesterase CpdA
MIMSKITWIHLSDLHWRQTQTYDANVVTSALLRDLADRARLAPELAQIDFIFVTGDLTFASRSSEYKLARKFLAELLQTTQVRKNRLFIVPGNHDVDRKVISTEARSVVKRAKDQQTIEDLFNNRADRIAVIRRFHNYRRFLNDYLGKHLFFDDTHYFYTKQCTVANQRVAILGLNSAWTSASNSDRLRLLLGERQVRAALKQAKSADIRIALMHHPFEWLADFDRSDCKPRLLRESDFVLSGHLHDPDLMHLKGPGVEAMIIGAGACYETRKHPNSYNLVQLDLTTGKGTIYFRAYSNREGGFWAPDVMRYPEVPGKHVFDLPADWVIGKSAEVSAIAASAAEDKPEETVVNPVTTASIRVDAANYWETGLDRWWNERGYTPNPFAWSNAADVTEEDWAGRIDSLTELFASWQVDPNIDISANLDPKERDERKRNIQWGYGDTPTLESIISSKTTEPVLIYAPTGGGKTFYRRWAVLQIRERPEFQAIEINKIAAGIRNRTDLTTGTLACLIFKQACEQLKISADCLPMEAVYSMWDRFEKMLRRLWPNQESARRTYMFVDGVDQLFDVEPAWNSKVLGAIAGLVKAADKQAGGEWLALRVFLPVQLQQPMEARLDNAKHIHSYQLQWTAEHCQMIVERRLSSCRKSDPTSDLAHLSRLFTPDALDEFLRWLQTLEVISPRCVISAMNGLAAYAWRRGVSTEPIKVEAWNDFVTAEKPAALCNRDPDYLFETPKGSKAPELGADLSNGDQLVGALSEEARSKHRGKLRQILAERFSEDELRTFCFDLSVDYEDLPGEGKAAKARELLALFERHDRVDELIQMGQKTRPDISWDDVSRTD